MFFDQRLEPNNFTNRAPRRFPTADLGGLISNVRRNTFMDSVTMTRQWNKQDNVNTWVTHHGKTEGGNMQENGIFPGNVQMPTILDPYSTQARKGMKNSQGEGMADTKPRTPPSSAPQIYGKVPAKIFHTLFCKGIDRRKQDNKIFAKIWGKITR